MCLRQSQARSAWPFTSGARLSLGLLFTDQPHVTSPIIACTQPPKRDARTQSRHPAPTDSSVSVCLPPANTINIQLRDRRLRAALGRSERCCAPFRGLCRAVFQGGHVHVVGYETWSQEFTIDDSLTGRSLAHSLVVAALSSARGIHNATRRRTGLQAEPAGAGPAPSLRWPVSFHLRFRRFPARRFAA